MAGSVNKVTLIGNLGREPEVRYTSDNKPIANITLATSDRWKDQSGQQQERTEWHRVVLFGALAEVAQKYLKKGDTVYFEGKLQTRKWQGQDGQDRYTTEVVIDQRGSMVMLGKAGGSSRSDSASNGDDYGTPMNQAPASKPSQVSADTAFDDDIPF